jgi:hypothetical protein
VDCSQQLSVLNILRKQVLCGTYLGQILIFAVNTGALMAEVNAHSRQVTSISVAVESAYVSFWQIGGGLKAPKKGALSFFYSLRCFFN